MQNTKTKKGEIEAICAKGYQLDFGTVFESAFENYKKIALYAGLMLLVSSFIVIFLIGFGVIAYIGVDHIEEFRDEMLRYSELEVKPLNIFIPLTAFSLLISAILHPFYSGFLKMADCGEKGKEFNFSTMFSYYKSPYLFSIFIYVIIIGFINNGLLIILQTVGLNFVGALLNLIISLLSYLTIPLIVFGNLNFLDAIKSSVLLALKQPLIILGLLIVSIIGSVIGIFGLCFGIFFTLPFMFSMQYVIYKNIIGIDESSEIDEISGTEK